jgi:AhpD family alkylhydroperoxidase
MSRIPSVPFDQFDAELRALVSGTDKSQRELHPTAIRAHHPEIAKAYLRFGAAMRQHGVLPARLKELVRLRIAFFNQCRSCMAMRYADAVDAGVSESLVCSLERPQDAADLTDAEKVALRYAERLATDHLAIDDAMHAELAQHFDHRAVVELGMYCGMCVGFGRLAATWSMVEDLPERFQADDDAPVTPWGPDAWVTARPAHSAA